MQSTRRRLRRLYHIAHKHVQAHQLDEAWPYVSEMLNIDMDDAGGLYLCGVIMREKGHIGLATQLCTGKEDKRLVFCMIAYRSKVNCI